MDKLIYRKGIFVDPKNNMNELNTSQNTEQQNVKRFREKDFKSVVSQYANIKRNTLKIESENNDQASKIDSHSEETKQKDNEDKTSHRFDAILAFEESI